MLLHIEDLPGLGELGRVLCLCHLPEIRDDEPGRQQWEEFGFPRCTGRVDAILLHPLGMLVDCFELLFLRGALLPDVPLGTVELPGDLEDPLLEFPVELLGREPGLLEVVDPHPFGETALSGLLFRRIIRTNLQVCSLLDGDEEPFVERLEQFDPVGAGHEVEDRVGDIDDVRLCGRYFNSVWCGCHRKIRSWIR